MARAPVARPHAERLDQLQRAPGVRLVAYREVEFLDRRVPAQADGDPFGHTPLRIAPAPVPLSIVVG